MFPVTLETTVGRKCDTVNVLSQMSCVVWWRASNQKPFSVWIGLTAVTTLHVGPIPALTSLQVVHCLSPVTSCYECTPNRLTACHVCFWEGRTAGGDMTFSYLVSPTDQYHEPLLHRDGHTSFSCAHCEYGFGHFVSCEFCVKVLKYCALPIHQWIKMKHFLRQMIAMVDGSTVCSGSMVATFSSAIWIPELSGLKDHWVCATVI